MQISCNSRYQQADKSSTGFRAFELTQENAAQLFAVDHTPGIFKDGKRSNATWLSSDFLYIDIDGGLNLREFQEYADFKGVFYILYTSRNHQKSKDGIVADRFHVLFPVNTITEQHELVEKLRILTNRYDFADKASKDAARFFFGNKEAQIIWHPGNPIEIQIFQDELPKAKKSQNIIKKQYTDDKKNLIMKALKEASELGFFDDYNECIPLGGAMKQEGYNYLDWISLCRSTDLEKQDPEAKWAGFQFDKLSGGTVMHYARMAQPELLQKGSLPPEPKPRIAQSILPTSTALTTLQIEPSKEVSKKIYDKITFKKTSEDGSETRHLVDGWYLELLSYDNDLRNCAKFDYTVGGPCMAYSNSELLKTAIRYRMRCYGVPEKSISDKSVDRLYQEIIYNNRYHNRVLSFTKNLKNKHGPGDGGELDKFLRFLHFKDHENYTNEQIYKLYKELFHIFLLRMHLHIMGTEQNENGYRGLITNDIVPILGGAQNIGKTTLCQWLACNREDMYVDLGSGSKGSFGTADTIRMARGKLIGELGEMKMMKDASNIEAVKSFISKTKYELDVKYVEHSEPLPSTISYIGTNNGDEFLSDITGNRRFFPVLLESIDKEALADNWALAEQLHAHYSYLAAQVDIKDRYNACMPSEALLAFMDDRRADAMIEYSDYAAIIEVVQEDFDKQLLELSSMAATHKLRSLDIQTMVYAKHDKAHLIVTKSSITKAMEDMGYKYTPTKGKDRASFKAWVKKLRE